MLPMKSQISRLRVHLRIATKNNLPACLLLLVVLLSACKKEAIVTEQPELTGTYALITVNGTKVPATVSHDGANLQVRSGSFTFKADGTCGTKTIFVPQSGTEATREASATYTRDGSKLTMRWQAAGTTDGTVAGNTFTMTNEGMVLVYQK